MNRPLAITASAMTKATALAFTAAIAFAAVPAQAAVALWDGTGADDSFSWGQLGPNFTVVPSGTGVVSTGGLGATLADSAGTMMRLDQGSGWFGSFGAGEQLLWNNLDGLITIAFANPVAAAGAQIQSDAYGDFIARITTSNGDFFDIGGNANSNGGDTNPFLGVRSDTADISSITFGLQTRSTSFAIGQLDIVGGGVAGAVPEPATWLMMMLGLGLVGGAMRSQRRRKLTVSYS